MGFMDWLGRNAVGLINAGVGLGTSLFNLGEQRKANQANISLTREQMDWASDEAQKEREWERPSNQIKMMQEAGLAPITYSSPVSQTSPPSAPSTHAQQPVTFNANPARDFAEVELLRAEADKMRSETDLNKVNSNRITTLLDFEKENQLLDIGLKRDELEKMRPEQLKQMVEQTENLKAERENLYQSLENLKKQWEQLDDSHKRALIENKHLEKVLTSQIAKNLAEAGMANKQAEYYAASTSSAVIQGWLLGNKWDVESVTFPTAVETAKNNAVYEHEISLWKKENPKTMYAIENLTSLLRSAAGGVHSLVNDALTILK